MTSKEDVFKNKENYANIWCEGNEDLKQVLLFLWNKNIWTCGCCSGHNGLKRAYVGLEIEDNHDTILKLLSSIEKENIIISFMTSKLKKIVSIKGNDKDIFKLILMAKYQENDKILEKAMRYVLNSNSKYTNLRLHYKASKLNIYI